jgi:metal-responsive CopG/Arc/MetJ family transcriptional regulator
MCGKNRLRAQSGVAPVLVHAEIAKEAETAEICDFARSALKKPCVLNRSNHKKSRYAAGTLSAVSASFALSARNKISRTIHQSTDLSVADQQYMTITQKPLSYT